MHASVHLVFLCMCLDRTWAEDFNMPWLAVIQAFTSSQSREIIESREIKRPWSVVLKVSDKD